MIPRKPSIRTTLICTLSALAIVTSAPRAALAAEPVDPSLILSTMRESLTRAPLAERVRVTIKPLGKASRSDEFLVKVNPGKKPDHADASLWIELGDLRVYAGDGRLVAVHLGDETSCYTIQYGGPLRPDTLRKLLPPIPAPLLALVLPDDPDAAPNVSTGLTPYTPTITWRSADASGAPGSEVVTMTGTREPFPGEHPQPEDTRVTMTIDARTSRPTRFTSFLPDAAELKLEFTPTVPGNPAAWPIRIEARQQVASLTDLRPRVGDAAAAHVVPELTLLDASWTSWDYHSVLRKHPGIDAPTPTHLALVFVRENAKDTFGAPSADAKAAEEELRKIEAELNSAPPGKETSPGVRLVHVVVPVMLTMDDTSRRKVENAVRLRESTAAGAGGGGGGGGGNIIWAASPERTIERFAPGAAGVAVFIRADNSLAGIVLLDGRAKDPKSLRADFRQALGLPEPTSPR